MTAPPLPTPARCVRLVALGGYARTLCNAPAGTDGVCRRHRYEDKHPRRSRRPLGARKTAP